MTKRDGKDHKREKAEDQTPAQTSRGFPSLREALADAYRVATEMSRAKTSAGYTDRGPRAVGSKGNVRAAATKTE